MTNTERYRQLVNAMFDRFNCANIECDNCAIDRIATDRECSCTEACLYVANELHILEYSMLQDGRCNFGNRKVF